MLNYEYKFRNQFAEKFNHNGLDFCEDIDFLDMFVYLTEIDEELARLTREINKLSNKKEELTKRGIIISNQFTPELFRERRKEREKV